MRLSKMRMAMIARQAQYSLKYFYNNVWAEGVKLAEEKFIPGDHTDKWCDELQAHLWTSKKAPRNHLKSCTLYSFLAWLMFRRNRSWETDYISYSQDLAGHHIKEFRKYIESNPYFEKLKIATDAQTIFKARWEDLQYHYDVEPQGVNTAGRGRHPHGIIVDDILKDPTQRKLNVDQIDYITRLFKEKITMMPKRGGYLHCWGTPQDTDDLFAVNKKSPKFHSTEEVALIDEEKGIVLWPQAYPLQALKDIRADIGEKAFNKELQCKPVRGEESFFHEADIDAVINKALVGFHPDKDEDRIRDASYVVGGMDLGKKRHPSHLVYFKVEENKIKQIHSKFLDNKDYSYQLEYVEKCDRAFGTDALFFDNTRGEFELYIEQDKLPASMSLKDKETKKNICAWTLTGKSKGAIAAAFDRFVSRKRIELLQDERQKKLILSVDNDLDAPETALGHGDSFWSVGLACQAAELYCDEETGVFDDPGVKGDKITEEDFIQRYGGKPGSSPVGDSETLDGLGEI